MGAQHVDLNQLVKNCCCLSWEQRETLIAYLLPFYASNPYAQQIIDALHLQQQEQQRSAPLLPLAGTNIQRARTPPLFMPVAAAAAATMVDGHDESGSARLDAGPQHDRQSPQSHLHSMPSNELLQPVSLLSNSENSSLAQLDAHKDVKVKRPFCPLEKMRQLVRILSKIMPNSIDMYADQLQRPQTQGNERGRKIPVSQLDQHHQHHASSSCTDWAVWTDWVIWEKYACRCIMFQMLEN